jgi:plasmid replication initiation protein
MKTSKNDTTTSANQSNKAAEEVETFVGMDMSGPERSAGSDSLTIYLETPEPETSAHFSVEVDMGSIEPDPPRRPKTFVLSPDWSSMEVVETPEHELSPPPKSVPRFRQLMVLMERPFFALSRTRTKPIDYVSEKDERIFVRVDAGPQGMATTYDADLLTFLIGKLSADAAANQTVLLRPTEFFQAVGSTKGGGQYQLLKAALDRLMTTRITTNANPDGKPGRERQFTWLDVVTRVPEGWEIQPCSWVREGAQSNYVLSVSPEYFGLGGLERFLYLTARKHTGRGFGKVFSILSDTLFLKSGSAGQKDRFKHEMHEIITRNALPEYSFRWRERGRGSAALIEMHRDGLLGANRLTRPSGG